MPFPASSFNSESDEDLEQVSNTDSKAITSTLKWFVSQSQALKANVIHKTKEDTNFHVIQADTTGVIKLICKEKS